MRLFDTHVHLDDARLFDRLNEVINNMFSAGVDRCVNVCCNLKKTEDAKRLVNENDCIYSAFGMHPHYACDMTNELMDELKLLMKSKNCVALGEIGLDYYYDLSERKEQCEWFDKQLCLAEETDMPVILHIREAFGDCMDILKNHKGKISGVMHCFSGSLEIAKRCIDMGLYVAFGGSVTFNNAVNLREVATKLPIERLVIETDCPYLTPVPYRGKVNEPMYVELVAKKLAELKNMSVEEVASITYNNALSLFRIKE